jgi:hypothetical protein
MSCPDRSLGVSIEEHSDIRVSDLATEKDVELTDRAQAGEFVSEQAPLNEAMPYDELRLATESYLQRTWGECLMWIVFHHFCISLNSLSWKQEEDRLAYLLHQPRNLPSRPGLPSCFGNWRGHPNVGPMVYGGTQTGACREMD